MLHDMTGADSSVSKCYFTRAKSGVLMKSETIAIRNREHRDWAAVHQHEP
jgi:predicted transcriptional regulator YheO